MMLDGQSFWGYLAFGLGIIFLGVTLGLKWVLEAITIITTLDDGE